MESIFRFLLMPIVWIPIVVILIVLTVRNYRKANRLQVLNVDSVLLMMEIPKDNDKKENPAKNVKTTPLPVKEAWYFARYSRTQKLRRRSGASLFRNCLVW